MRRVKLASAALGLIIGVLAAGPSAFARGLVEVLAFLPDLTGQPPGSGVKSSVEGLTVGLPAGPGGVPPADNNIYAASSGTNTGTTPLPNGPANLFVIPPTCPTAPCNIRQVAIANSSPIVNGLRFNPVTRALWVLDAGNGQVLNVDTSTGGSSVLASGFPANTTLNALTFDAAGNGYVTDSINGAIYRIPSGGGTPTTWSSDPRLRPLTGTATLLPSFGANGIELSPVGCDPAGLLGPRCTSVLVANTANRNIVQIAVNSDGTAGGALTYTNGINGPDGIAIDRNNNVWVAAGQSDEIVVFKPIPQQMPPIMTFGKVIAKLGDFGGIISGSVNGLLFPASLAFSHNGSTLYVSNLASPNQRSIDSAWATQVQTYTVSKLGTGFLPLPGE
jgi:sugar lactone lactonase YvrE